MTGGKVNSTQPQVKPSRKAGAHTYSHMYVHVQVCASGVPVCASVLSMLTGTFAVDFDYGQRKQEGKVLERGLRLPFAF